jgi:hypothetical protein
MHFPCPTKTSVHFYLCKNAREGGDSQLGFIVAPPNISPYQEMVLETGQTDH